MISDDALERLFFSLLFLGLLAVGTAVLMDSESPDPDLMLPAVLSFGLGTILMAHHGRRTGKIRSRSGHISRAEHPILFWMIYVICLAGGWVMVIGVFWKLFLE